MTTYYRLRFLVPADREDLLAAELGCRGTLGVEWLEDRPGRSRAAAWFPDPLPAMAGALDRATCEAWGVELVASERVEERDWLAEYRRRAMPVLIGRELVVDPREPELAAGYRAPPGRRLLRVPARRAFGTGSHASTRLVLELLEEKKPRDLTVLDVGTGTGILSFAALLWGARRVVALDQDPVAVFMARENSRLNDLAPQVWAGRLGALEGGARFELVLVNVLLERIRGELPRLIEAVVRGGEIVMAGLVEADAASFERQAERCRLEIRQRRSSGEWLAYRMERR